MRGDNSDEWKRAKEMAVQMTNDQLAQLIQTLQQGQGHAGGVAGAAAATVVGPMAPCVLRKDKIKRLR